MNRKKLEQTVNAALEYHHRGELDEAARLYAAACQAAPRVFDPWVLAGSLEFHRKNLEKAADLLTRALRLDASSSKCKLFLGMTLTDLGRHAEAEKYLRSAVQKHPNYPEAWTDLGTSLCALGRGADAVACFEKAIALKSDDAIAHERLGELLVSIRGLAAAEPHFRRAIEINPDFSIAWSNLGLALVEATGRLSEAMECFDRAAEADPLSGAARNGRALALLHSYRQDDALREYEAAIALSPADPLALSARAMVMNYLSWPTREEIFVAHTAYAAAVNTVTVPSEFRGTRDPERRLRIGFVSPDLRAHAVATFLEPLLKHLDRKAFEIYLYHNHAIVDAMSERLKSLATGWRNLHGIADDQAAALIQRDAPDILIDLAGHSSRNRLGLFARRLAPVQVTYLGYPNTTGLTTVDYRLTDALADPLGDADTFVAEQLVRFAPCGWAYSPVPDAPEVSPPPSASSGAVTFGSFNNFTKVTDETLRAWAHLLQQVPGSRLLLKSRYFDEPTVSASVRTRLRAAGLPDDRVVLLEHTSTTQSHLTAYAQIDVALDTFPYHGTTTTCEALWQGVPVVTLAGDRHASRVGVSLLTAVGHPELIGADLNDYVRIAVELARDAERLNALRNNLRSDLARSALLDHTGQAAHFGAALRQCWRQWCEQGALAVAV